MQTYRLAESENEYGLPFLLGRHAYLADGTPLTKCDQYDRIVPASPNLGIAKATCHGGLLSLADRQDGIAALARALNDNDAVKAPLILLHLQIDPATTLRKFNHWHKRPGPGGGQFTTAEDVGSGSVATSPLQPVEWSLNVRFTSTYKPGLNGPDVDIAHNLVKTALGLAILQVTKLGFQPGMPDYGQQLHQALANNIKALNDPELTAEPIYLNGKFVSGKTIPPGASQPDVVYGPVDRPIFIFELKSGRVANTLDRAVAEQRLRTLGNVPGNPGYDYFLVTEQ